MSTVAAGHFSANPRPGGAGRAWWAVRDSNPRHPACKAGALPAELTARAQRSYPSAAFGSRRQCRPHTAAGIASICIVTRMRKDSNVRLAQRLTASLSPLPALNFGCFDAGMVDLLAGSRIASNRLRAFRDMERPEPDQTNLLPFLQRIGDRGRTRRRPPWWTDPSRFAATDATAATRSFLFTESPPSVGSADLAAHRPTHP